MKHIFSLLAFLISIIVLSGSLVGADPFPVQFNDFLTSPLTAVSDVVGSSLSSGTITANGTYFYGGGGSTTTISKIIFDGAVHSTFTTFQTGPSTTGTFNVVSMMTPIVDGVFFFPEKWFHSVVRWDTATDQPYQLVGSAGSSGYVNGVGTPARFNQPAAVALDLADGQLFVAESLGSRIRRVAATTTTAMNQGEAFFVSGNGQPPFMGGGLTDSTDPNQVRFFYASGIVVAHIQGTKYLYVTQDSHPLRRVVAATGATTTIIGIDSQNFVEGYSATARIVRTIGLAPRDLNSLWVADLGATAVAILSWNADGSEHYLHRVRSVEGVTSFAVKAADSVSRTGIYLPVNIDQRFYEFGSTAVSPATPGPSPSGPSPAGPPSPNTPSPGQTVCTCDSALTVDYANTLVPDAAQEAFITIGLDTNTWEVDFSVLNVLSVTNGHVIAASVDARGSNVTDSIKGVVSSPFDTAALWTPVSPCADLSGIDTPAASLGVAVGRVVHNCTRNFHVKYSLINSGARTTHCTLSNNAQNEIEVSCELQLTTIRAYDLTEANAYLAKETVFRASITMPRNLPNEVGTLLHASLAKCSVLAAPAYYVDCRIPALWNFAPTFSVTQSPSWIIDSSCSQTNGTDATYIRCDLQSLSQIYTEATATITATVIPSGQTMNFNVNYSLPREETATATGSLASFVKSIGTKDGKFYYGNDDLLTLEIEVVETARLQITQLELFNSDSPVQTYDLRTTPEFETVETQNATFFVITFYPARKLDDSNFYLHGPHGVNVSFLFTTARRQEGDGPQAGDQGVVTYSGIGLKAPKSDSAAQTSNGNSNASGVSQTAVAAITAGALVAVVAVVAATVMIVRSKKTATAETEAATKTVEVTEAEV